MLAVGFPGWRIPRQEHYEEVGNTALEKIIFAQ